MSTTIHRLKKGAYGGKYHTVITTFDGKEAAENFARGARSQGAIVKIVKTSGYQGKHPHHRVLIGDKK